MGLACSSSIAQALKGDVAIKRSRKGFTHFAFKIPVEVEDMHDQIVQGNDQDPHQVYKVPGDIEELKFSEPVKKFLAKQKIQSL